MDYGVQYGVAPTILSTSLDSSVKGKFAISKDGGITWDFEYSKGLPENCIPIKMSVKENENQLIIAIATFNKGFYISVDNGKTFTSINDGMDTYNDFIWGEDVIINGDKVYCLTSNHNYGGEVPAKLYEYNIFNKTVKKINLSSDIKIAKNLAIDKNGNLYISVLPWFEGRTLPEINKWFFVNIGGGVYKYDGETVSIYFKNEDGIYDCCFDEEGNMYAVSVYGQVFYVKDGQGKLYADGMFNQLREINLSNDGSKLYVSSMGGGTYRMPTIEKSIENNGEDEEKPLTPNENENNSETKPSQPNKDENNTDKPDNQQIDNTQIDNTQILGKLPMAGKKAVSIIVNIIIGAFIVLIITIVVIKRKK